MILLFCFLFLITSLVVSKAFTGTVMTPLGIFGSVWNGLLILFEMRLVAYSPVSAKAYVLLLGSYAVFFLGAVTVLLSSAVINGGRRFVSMEMRSGNPMCNLATLYRFIRIYGVVSAIGFAVWVYKVWIDVGGIEAFLSSASFRSLLLSSKGGGIQGYMLSLGLSCALLAGMYIAYGGKRSFRACLFLLPLIGYSIITGARALTIWALLLLVSPLLLIIGQRNKGCSAIGSSSRKYIALSGIVLTTIFIAVGISRGIVQYTVHLIGYYTTVPIPPSLIHIYVYMTGPFGAFSHLLSSWEGGIVPFAGVFTPLAKILDLFGFSYPSAAFETLQLYASIPFHFNTYTYLADWYIDLGLVGIILGPYSLGAISTYLATRLAYLHPMKFAWASFFLVYLIFAFTCSITSKNAFWVAMVGAMVGVYQASVHRVRKKKLVTSGGTLDNG